MSSENKTFKLDDNVGRSITRGSHRINRLGPLVEMTVLLALVILFNFFPEKIGYFVTGLVPTSFVPVLAPEFAVHLPWLNALWGLALALALAKLIAGQWIGGMRWAELGLSVFGIYVIGRIIAGGPVIGLNPEWAATADAAIVADAGQLLPRLDNLRWILSLVLVFAVVDAGRKLYRLLGTEPLIVQSGQFRIIWPGIWQTILFSGALAALLLLDLGGWSILIALSLAIGILIGLAAGRQGSRDV